MYSIMGSPSFLATEQLDTYVAVAGIDSSKKGAFAHDGASDVRLQEKARTTQSHNAEKTVLLAMRPTCARNDYQASLTDQGFRTIAVDDAEQGLRILTEALPDLVVVEPELGGGSGDRLLHGIERDMRFHQIPVFVVSATANRSAIFRVARFKIDDFAVLPISVGAFTIRVIKLLNRRKA